MGDRIEVHTCYMVVGKRFDGFFDCLVAHLIWILILEEGGFDHEDLHAAASSGRATALGNPVGTRAAVKNGRIFSWKKLPLDSASVNSL